MSCVWVYSYWQIGNYYKKKECESLTPHTPLTPQNQLQSIPKSINFILWVAPLHCPYVQIDNTKVDNKNGTTKLQCHLLTYVRESKINTTVLQLY